MCADDASRPLSAKGRADIEKMAWHLHACGVKPDHIMHSPLLRAVQTAEILAKILGVTHVTQSDQGLDGLDPVDPIVDATAHWHDDTMLVGHLPFLSKLISALVVDNEHHALVNFAPGSVACLDQYQRQFVVNWLLRPDVVCDRAGDHIERLF